MYLFSVDNVPNIWGIVVLKVRIFCYFKVQTKGSPIIEQDGGKGKVVRTPTEQEPLLFIKSKCFGADSVEMLKTEEEGEVSKCQPDGFLHEARNKTQM